MMFSMLWVGLSQVSGQTLPSESPLPAFNNVPTRQGAPSQAGASGAAITALAADFPTALVLSPQQELLYRGTFQEDFLTNQVAHGQGWRFESRFLVLNGDRGYEVAGFTQVRPKEIRSPGAAKEAVPGTPAPRIEDAGSSASHVLLSRVLSNGQTQTEEKSDRPVALEGLPLREMPIFVGLPLDSRQAADGWKSQERGRPDWFWTITGKEAVQGTRCIVVEGVQSPPEWDKPRADRQSWQRKAKLWVSAGTGIVHRFEKTYERRDPARSYVSLRTSYKGELDSTLGYPGQLFEDRRREVTLAFQAQEETMTLAEDFSRNLKALDSLTRQLNAHTSENPKTPYRVAIQGVLRKIDLAKKGELAPRAEEETAGSDTVAGPAIGKVAPDFLVPSLDKAGTVSLRNWKNKPALLLFYHPESQSAVSCLSFAEQIHQQNKGKLNVLGLSVLGDARKVTIQKETMKLGFPLLDGGGLKISYGLDATPKWYLLDNQMIIRVIHSGWGDEVRGDLSHQAQALTAVR